MKLNKYLFAVIASAGILGVASPAAAQDVKLKCMEWNILSFEYTDNSNAVNFSIDEAVSKIKAQNPDIICFNEFETASGRMSSVEKLTECAKALNMFPFFIYSYDKDSGAYGNGILSKYPIVNAASTLLGKYAGADQRSVGWADILVPTDAHPEGVKVRIVCTHLDAFGGEATCLAQAKEVLDYAIAPAVAAGIPTLLMGDMNTGYNSSTIVEYEKTGTRLCNNAGTYLGSSKLDYLISYPKGSWSCTDFKVPSDDRLIIISDHRPIVGTAVLKN